MTDSISVQFGADTGGMMGGLKQVGDGVKNFSDQAKAHVEGITATFGKLQEMMIGVAAVVAGGALFKEMVGATVAATGEVTMLQKAFGMTNEQANLTRSSLGLLGISTEAYTGMANKLDMQLRRGSDSLTKMGLTAKDLDLGQKGVMDKAIGILAQYKEGVDRNIAAQVLFGRGGAEANALIKLSMDGVSTKAKELEEALGLTVTKTDQDNAKQYKLVINELGMAFEGIKKTIGSAVLPYLTAFGDWFVSVVPILIKGMKDNMAAIVEAAFNAAEGFVNFVTTVVTGVYNLFVLWEYIQAKLGNTTTGDAMASISKFEGALDSLKTFRDNAVGVIRDLKEKVLAAKPFAGLNVGNPKTGNQSAAGLIEDGGSGKDATSAAMKAADGEIKVLRASLDQKKTLLDQGVAQYRITEDQKFAALMKFTQQEYEAEKSILQNEMTTGNLSLTQKQNILNKLKELEQKHGNEMIVLDGQSVAAQQKIWQGYLSSVQTAWDSELRGMLAGTTTFRQAMKNIFGNLAIQVIQEFEKIAVKWAAVELGKTTATVSGAAARASAEEAGQSVGLISMFANAVKAIMADSAKTFSGIFAFLSPELGPAAAGPAAVGAGVVAGAVSMIPALAVGTPMVLADGLAMLHKGEAVVPAAVNGPWQGGAGGGQTVHIHFTANGAMSATEIKGHARTIARALNDHWVANPSTRPKY